MFKVTATTSNLAEITAPGDVVELHKDGMRLSAQLAVLTESNIYRDGKIAGGNAKRAWGAFGTIMAATAVTTVDPTGTAAVPNGPPSRILAAGDKCWIVSITVQKDGVVFKLLTDPDDNGIRYRGDLKFPFPNKNQVPTMDAFLPTIAEALSVVPMEPPAPEPAPEVVTPPAPPARHDGELEPPPPPPPADTSPPTIALGQTKDKVTASFGQPVKIIKQGVKEIYIYKDMKVTFTNGKVSNVE
jgi:hypothetical protein